MATIPTSPASWQWGYWGGESFHAPQWYIGRGFEEGREQYWELKKPIDFNVIGLVQHTDDGRWLWVLDGDGWDQEIGGYRFRTGPFRQTIDTIGLHWNPTRRAVSLFLDGEFQDVIWENILEGGEITPVIQPGSLTEPRRGQTGEACETVNKYF